ncbi:pyruvate/2-oxoglutarate dehydrogenase complex, dihydrolipoamide dehydrogenase component [Leptolyngbyaceae cyanobacterium JSC-12]|nr:pyruvate/2-oxoglutarate dehydrogenase complex, dihydrolipoamide dehydrogenase component [Leptolyngbyaceae cyanobacterium JSC-12]
MLWQPFSRSLNSVSLGKQAFNSFSWAFEQGIFYKIRFDMGKFRYIDPVKWFNLSQRSDSSVRQDEAIVVVGVGIAAFAFVRSLRRLGYTNVTIIARDEAFGGKCVNYGCMPSEFYMAHRDEDPSIALEKGKAFVTSLRKATEQSFKELGFPLVQGEVTAVEGNRVVLHTGETYPFDRLVLATGNRQPKWSLLEPTCSLKEFWDILSGKLVIVSDGNVASLTYASIARDRGLDITVIFTSPPLLGHLPSFQYFRRELEKQGVEILSPAKVQGRDDNRLLIKIQGKLKSIDFDHVMYDGVPELNLPPIDGSSKTILDLDLRQASVIGRSNIYVLGDASGFLSATEAELQAKQLANAWSSGELSQMQDFARLPVRVHARKSFAMVGGPWTLLYPNWRSVDFKMLGWSAVHNEAGKLWYLYNPQDKKVEAIHICHRDASELISLASVLIDLPVTDTRWLTSSIHPTSAEIFKIMIEDIEAGELATRSSEGLLGTTVQSGSDVPSTLISLPPVSHIHRSSFYQTVFTPEERAIGILDQNPSLYFATLLGIKTLLGSEKSQTSIVLRRSAQGLYWAKGLDFSYEVDPNSTCVTLNLLDKSVTIYMGSLTIDMED